MNKEFLAKKKDINELKINKADKADLSILENSIDDLNNTKVDKVEGKGLSTNDYTTAEKTKLDGIEDGANKTIVDDALSGTSTNPVQNKVVQTAVDNLIGVIQDNYLNLNNSKVDKAEGMGLSKNNFTDELKNKLDGIEDGANKTIVDDALSDTSTNPIQNKIVQNAVNNLVAVIQDNYLSLNNAKADVEHTHNYAGSSSAGGSANSAEKLANAITINGVSFDGTSNITIKDSTKTDYTPSYTANNATGGAAKYYKLFTVTPTSNYTDGAYRFTVASRQGICEITYRIISDNNLYINTKTTGSFTGSSGIASNIKTYFYKDTDNAITKMKVYCTIPAWDTMRFYKILHNDHYNTVAWDFKAVTALPTDFTSELALTNKNCLPLSGGTITGTLKTSSSGKLLYSSSDSASSPITISITNLFTNYTMAVCNIQTSTKSKFSVVLPLQYIKSLGTSAYYETDGLLFYYVTDSSIKISTGLAQSNPTIENIKIINLL